MYDTALFIYIDGVMNITSGAFLNTTLQITEASMIGTVTAMLPFIYGTMWFDDVRIYNNTSLCSTDIIHMNFLLVRYSSKITHRTIVVFLAVIVTVRFIR